MKDIQILKQTVKLSDQLDSLCIAHSKALNILVDYKTANRRLAHAMDNNDEGKASQIRAEIAKLKDEYIGITMTLLFNETI